MFQAVVKHYVLGLLISQQPSRGIDWWPFGLGDTTAYWTRYRLEDLGHSSQPRLRYCILVCFVYLSFFTTGHPILRMCLQ